MGGYGNCTETTKSNLREIARMAYGSGLLEGKSGGAGRMGIWSFNNQKRIIKFNTHLSERLKGPSISVDKRMLESSNNLRQELLHIARAAMVSDEVMNEIRSKLGVIDSKLPNTLLDRTTVAKVVTLIGGQKKDELWNDALQENGKDISAYASTGKDMHFATFVDERKNVQNQNGKMGTYKDDRVEIVSSCLETILTENLKRGFLQSEDAASVRNVLNEEAIKACASDMAKAEHEDPLMERVLRLDDVKRRLKTCVQLILSMKQAGNQQPGIFERQMPDLRAACIHEMGRGEISSYERTLRENGLEFTDLADESALFADPSVRKFVEDALAALKTASSGDPSSRRDKALKLCKNIAWAIESALAGCSNGEDRRACMQNIALCFSADEGIRRLLQGSDNIDLAQKAAEQDPNVGIFVRIAHAAQRADELRAMRKTARDLADRWGLPVKEDDVLFSTKGDPYSTAEALFGEDADEALRARLQFVRYRLSMLETVATAIKENVLGKDDLNEEKLGQLLAGKVPESLPQGAKSVLQAALARSEFEALSGVSFDGLPESAKPVLRNVLTLLLARMRKNEDMIRSDLELKAAADRLRQAFADVVTAIRAKLQDNAEVPTVGEALRLVIDALDAGGGSTTFQLCHTFAALLEKGLLCCTNVADAKDALEGIATRILERDAEVSLAISERIEQAAQSAEELRAMRKTARGLADRWGLPVKEDDVLFSTQGDPYSTTEALFGEDADEALRARLQFVRYRLSMLETVATAIKENVLGKDDLNDEKLGQLLAGRVPESLPQGAKSVLKAALARSEFDVLFGETIRTFPENRQSTLKKVMARRFAKRVESEAPIGSEDALKGIMALYKPEVNALVMQFRRLLDAKASDAEIEKEFSDEAPMDNLLRRDVYIDGVCKSVWEAAGKIPMPDFFRELIMVKSRKLYDDAVEDYENSAAEKKQGEDVAPFDADKALSSEKNSLVSGYSVMVREYVFLSSKRAEVVKMIAGDDLDKSKKVAEAYDWEMRNALSPEGKRGPLGEFAHLLDDRETIVKQVSDRGEAGLAEQVKAEFDRQIVSLVADPGAKGLKKTVVHALMAKFARDEVFYRHAFPEAYDDISRYKLQKWKGKSHDDVVNARSALLGTMQTVFESPFLFAQDEKNISPLENEMREAYRMKLLTIFDDETEHKKLMGLFKAYQDAIKPVMRPDDLPVDAKMEVPTQDQVESFAKAAKALGKYLKEKTEIAAAAAFGAVSAKIDQTELKLIRALVGEQTLSIALLESKLEAFDLTVEDAKKMTDEQIELLARLQSKSVDKHLDIGPMFLHEALSGQIEPAVLTGNMIMLIRKLLSANIDKDLVSYMRGLGTSSAREVVRILAANGFDKIVNQINKDVSTRQIKIMAKAISLLYSVNRGAAGLDKACQRIFNGKTIDQVTEADVNNVQDRIDQGGDPANPFAGIDPLFDLKGFAGDIVGFLVSGVSVSSLPSFCGEADAKSMRELGAALRDVSTFADDKSCRQINLNGVAVKLSKDEYGRLVIGVGGLAAVSAQSIARLYEDLARAIVGSAKTYDAAVVKSVLPPEKGPYDMAAREICTRCLQNLLGLPAIRFSHIPTSELVKSAHAALKTNGGDKGEIENILKRIKNPSANFASEESRELCGRIAKVGPEAVKSRVTISDEAMPPSVLKMRAFAAELFQRENFWLDDEVTSREDRLKALLIDNASLVLELMRNPASFDAFKVGLGEWQNRENRKELVSKLKDAVKGIRDIIPAAKDEELTVNAVRQALDSPAAEEVLKTAAKGIDEVGAWLVEAAQATFLNDFVKVLENEQPDSGDIAFKTIKALSGAGTINVRKGLGKLLADALKRYFSEATGADRAAILRSLVCNTPSENATSVDIMSALVKGAGPVLQKLIQGIPLDVVPQNLRPVIECAKSSLPPVPRDYVRAKLFDLVERSGGRITSIEVKRSLGAATVSEALLCVVKTPDSPVGEECVIKVLRPEVQMRTLREGAYLRGLVTEDGALSSMLESRLKLIAEEMDLTVEDRNIEIGRKYCFTENGQKIDSVSRHPLIGATPGALALRKAPGVTIDRCIAEANGRIAEIADRFKNGTAGRPIPEVAAAKLELMDIHRRMASSHNMLIAFARKWTEEALFGSGTFHGDLHDGNIMVDKDQLTVIDYGNVVRLTDKERVNLMEIIASCGINLPEAFDKNVGALMTEGDRKNFESVKGTLNHEVEIILQKGSEDDIPFRLMALVNLMERKGLAIPAVLLNFSQSLTRLLTTLDAVEESLLRAKALFEDIGYDMSSKGDAFRDIKVGDRRCRVSKTNFLDFTGSYADSLEVVSKKIQLGAKYPSSSETSNETFETGEKFEADFRVANHLRLSEIREVFDYVKPVGNLIRTREGYEELKSKVVEIWQLAVGHLLDGAGDKLDFGDDTMNRVFARFEKAMTSLGWSEKTDPKMFKAAQDDFMFELLMAIKNAYYDDETCQCSILGNFARTLYPDFNPTYSYGVVLYNLVGANQELVTASLDNKSKAQAVKYYFFDRKKSEQVESDAAKAKVMHKKWLEAHPGFSHYEAEKLKETADDLLIFNDGIFPRHYHWAAQKDDRTEFLKGMDGNLKLIAVQLRKIGQDGKDDNAKALRLDCLMNYYMYRTGAHRAFVDTWKPWGNGLSNDEYEELLKEAEAMDKKAGRDQDDPGTPTLVKAVKFFRKAASKENK